MQDSYRSSLKLSFSQATSTIEVGEGVRVVGDSGVSVVSPSDGAEVRMICFLWQVQYSFSREGELKKSSEYLKHASKTCEYT